MSAPEIVDGEAVDEEQVARPAELLPVHAPPPVVAVAPQVKPAELVTRLEAIREAQEKAMVRDTDYGVIPGTDKPTLFKPGAEKLAVLFQLDVQLANEKAWGPGDHLTVISRATVFHAPSGARLGYGEGVCTTRERKYAYRQQQRACPACEQAAIIKGNEKYGGGWVCWKKRGGCGAKFPDGSPEIESQEVGEIDNPDLPDLWNTVVKMAEKRARVDAVLAVTGASALFTQDLEDTATADAERSTAQPPAEEEKITARQMSAWILPAKRKVGISQTVFTDLLKRFGVERLEDLPRNKAKALHEAITALKGDVPPDTEGLVQEPLEPSDTDPFES